MSDDAMHVIEISDDDGERAYWQCDCGRSGSAASADVDFAAERHIPDGKSRAYRHSGGIR